MCYRSLRTAVDAAHSAYQPITVVDMMEELFNWRRGFPAEVAKLNAECAGKSARGTGKAGRGGRVTPAGHLSQNAACRQLQRWYDELAPASGTVGRWLKILNNDNAGYFFQRLGEPQWENVEFSVTDILDEISGTYKRTTLQRNAQDIFVWNATTGFDMLCFKAAVDDLIAYKRHAAGLRETGEARPRPPSGASLKTVVGKWKARHAAHEHATSTCR